VGVEWLYVEPGSLWENGCVESFNSRSRDGLLDRKEFENVSDARAYCTPHRLEYNYRRPHSALEYRTLAEFAAGSAVPSVRPTASLRQQHSRNPECLPFSVTQNVLP
jgi:transposase InsO family protein